MNKKISAYLTANGFVFQRKSKHYIFTNGKLNIAVCSSPSDHRNNHNTIRDIRRVQRMSGRPFVDPFNPKKRSLP